MSDDEGMSSAEGFDQVQREICASGPASDGDNLLGMEIDFCAYLPPLIPDLDEAIE